MLEKLIINKKLLKELDFGVIIIALLIVSFGVLNIYSAARGISADTLMANVNPSSFAKKQIIWIPICLVALYFVLLFDYSTIQGYSSLIYWFGIILLVLNDFVFGKNINGAKSWMQLGPVSIQASEFAKLGMIVMLAKKLDDMEGNINNVKNFFILMLYVLIPMALILYQSDMGITMVCFFIVLGIFYMAGLNSKVICGGLASVVVLIGVVWNTPLMKPYWKGRLTGFLHPEEDELGLGLQLLESMKAIGSGGLFGTGYLKSQVIIGGHIPEAHTDFIFASVGEEWGLVGALILIIMYGILIYKLFVIAKNSKDIFGKTIASGVISGLLFCIFQNIGMTIGIMPITGLTLPLMSYGGSSLLTVFISLGLVLNVGMRKKKINF